MPLTKSNESISPKDQCIIITLLVFAIVACAFATYAIVQTGVFYESDNAVDHKMRELQEAIKNVTLISNPCFTCDTSTGDVTFTSSLDNNWADVDKLVHFRETRQSVTSSSGSSGGTGSGLTGLSLPGRAFMNSPLSPKEGAPTFLGDVIQAVDAGFSQIQKALGLRPATAPGSQKPLEAYPNPMSFSRGPAPSGVYSMLGLGSYLKSDTNVRCSPSEMSPTPSVYFVYDNGNGTIPVDETPIHLCICTHDYGEYCTSTVFVQ